MQRLRLQQRRRIGRREKIFRLVLCVAHRDLGVGVPQDGPVPAGRTHPEAQHCAEPGEGLGRFCCLPTRD